MTLPDHVLEWVQKAEDDFAGARTLLRRRGPLPDLVCYHAQQCAEKYLKALLVLREVDFPKTHHLLRLLHLALPLEPALEALREDLKVLNAFSVNFRYPDASATLDEARLAMRSGRRVRKAMRKALGLGASGGPSNLCNPCNLW